MMTKRSDGVTPGTGSGSQVGLDYQGDSLAPTRRQLLYGGVAVAATALLASCEQSPEPGEGPTSDPAGMPTEAPELAERVASGDLPPLAERLPETPAVVEPLKQVGTYGGQWNAAMLGPSDTFLLDRTVGYDPPLRWEPDPTNVVPNLATSVEAEDDGRAYVIRLRPGTKWSDGEPFTADDVVFAIEDVLYVEELYPDVPSFLRSGDQPAAVEKVDEVTVRIVFPEPSGLFLQDLGQFPGQDLVRFPLHHFRDLHLKYNPEADRLAQSEGFSSWTQLFPVARAEQWAKAGIPTLNAWHITTPVGEGSRVVAERNPYYWKTDPNGSQLPYLDRIVFEVVSDREVVVLKATNGELDMQSRHLSNADKPALAQNQEAGDYHFFDLVPTTTNSMLVNLNLTHQDPNLRAMFQNKDFRIGLSHAINRSEIIQIVHQNQSEPWQAAPRRDSEFFNEELAKQFTEYDVDLANSHLDKAGYSQRDGDGFRLRPDGERVSFTIDFSAMIGSHSDAIGLIAGYWEAVGVEVNLSGVERSLLQERLEANEHDVTAWWGNEGGNDAMIGPGNFFPFNTGQSRYAVLWAKWYRSGGTDGEEPPEATRQQTELYDQLRATPDPDEQQRLFREIVTIAQEEFYTIGTVLRPSTFGVAKTNFHNLPDSITSHIIEPAQTHPEQYYIS